VISAKSKSVKNDLGDRLGHDISTPAARRRAYWHVNLTDHGILRGYWTNLAEVTPGVWRSNQPSPYRLRKYHDRGITTVLNLRGANENSPYLFEKEACDALGLTLISHAMTARALVAPSSLLALLDIFESIERPFIMHCKSGADRAGFAAALYLLHMQGADIAEATKQLSFRFFHRRSTQAGILDHVLDAYGADTESQPVAIRDWIENQYKPKKLTEEFNAKRGRS